MVAVCERIRRQRHEPHDRRVHLRRRPERAGRHLEQVFHAAARLQHDAQPAVDLAARVGGHAVHHFLLQHEVHVADRGGVLERVEQQRRGDVVGQVADQADRCAARERGDVDGERVGFDDLELADARGRRAQARGQVAVELDRGQRADAREQREGERAFARADLDEALARLRVDRAQQPVDDAALVQEMLPEALLHHVRFGHGRARSNVSTANATAVARLDGSARPVPAMSSAVPWSTDVRR
jgi:hypothetical protein